MPADKSTFDGRKFSPEIQDRFSGRPDQDNVQGNLVIQTEEITSSSVMPEAFEKDVSSLVRDKSVQSGPVDLVLPEEYSSREVWGVSRNTNAVVQGYVSEGKTLRQKLSEDAYREGVGVHDTERIPGFGADNAHIDQIADVFAKRVTALQERGELTADEPLVVYELGAGHGLDGRRFLSTLQEIAPETYARTMLVETDIAEAAVEGMKPIFDDHQGHVRFDVLDAANPKISREKPPLLVMGKQVLSALPTRRIGMSEDGSVCELMTSARMGKNRPLLCVDREEDKISVVNASEALEEPLRNPEVRRLLKGQLVGDNNILHQGAVCNIEGELSNWSPAEQKETNDFLKQIQYNSLHSHNEGAEICVIASLSRVRPGGMVIFTDFMRTDNSVKLPSHLQQRQSGAVSSTTVEGWRLAMVARENGASAAATEFPQGHRQSIIFDTAPPEIAEQTAATFREGMGLDPTQLHEFEAVLEKTLDQINVAQKKGESIDSEKIINDLYEQLPQATRENYFTQVLIAQRCNKNDLPGLALRYAQQAVEAAPHAGVVGYLQLAKALNAVEQPEQADRALCRAREIAPTSAEVHRACYEFYEANEQWEAYADSVTDYLATAHDLQERSVVALLLNRSRAQVLIAKDALQDYTPAEKFRVIKTTARGHRVGQVEMAPYSYSTYRDPQESGLPRSVMTRIKAYDAIMSAKEVATQLLTNAKKHDLGRMVITELGELAEIVAFPGPRMSWVDQPHSDETSDFVWAHRPSAQPRRGYSV